MKKRFTSSLISFVNSGKGFEFFKFNYDKRQKFLQTLATSQMLGQRKGQLTIFIIAAVVVIALIAMVYLFFPGVLVGLGIVSGNPQTFIQNCIEENLKENVEKISLQGGYLEPENFILYKDNKIEYLCYNENYYLPCVMQQPFLKQQVENEIKRGVKNQADICFDSMQESFERRGYEVNLQKGGSFVELLPERIVLIFENELTLTQGSESQRFEKINIVLNNNLYELTSIANSILNWEAIFGDAETTIYMSYYHDLKVEKIKQSDGGTVYILTDRNTRDKFQFASRSVVFPPGIAVEEVV